MLHISTPMLHIQYKPTYILCIYKRRSYIYNPHTYMIANINTDATYTSLNTRILCKYHTDATFITQTHVYCAYTNTDATLCIYQHQCYIYKLKTQVYIVHIINTDVCYIYNPTTRIHCAYINTDVTYTTQTHVYCAYMHTDATYTTQTHVYGVSCIVLNIQQRRKDPMVFGTMSSFVYSLPQFDVSHSRHEYVHSLH